MPFDETLANRIRERLEGRSGVAERKMFGGLAFLVRGHLCCGVVGSDLVVRVGPAAHARLLREPHTRPMDFTGRPLKGLVYVSPSGLRTRRSLRKWVDRGFRFARRLPPKTAKR